MVRCRRCVVNPNSALSKYILMYLPTYISLPARPQAHPQYQCHSHERPGTPNSNSPNLILILIPIYYSVPSSTLICRDKGYLCAVNCHVRHQTTDRQGHKHLPDSRGTSPHKKNPKKKEKLTIAQLGRNRRQTPARSRQCCR
jgi:hypothetical protein